jgi:hypothetical protein
VIKLTFEGNDYPEVHAAIKKCLEDFRALYQEGAVVPPVTVTAASLGKLPPDKKDAADRMAKVRAAKAQKQKEKAPEPPKAQEPEPQPEPEPKAPEPDFEDIVIERPAPEPELTAAELAVIKLKATEEMRAAWSIGKHDQVLALLAKFGNGAKSFRELQNKDFPPIRKAIDEGALA